MIDKEDFLALGLYEPLVNQLIYRVNDCANKEDEAKLWKFLSSCTGSMDYARKEEVNNLVSEAFKTGISISKPKVDVFNKDVKCPKCEGRGDIWAFRGLDNGLCYQCNGLGLVSEKGEALVKRTSDRVPPDAYASAHYLKRYNK